MSEPHLLVAVTVEEAARLLIENYAEVMRSLAADNAALRERLEAAVGLLRQRRELMHSDQVTAKDWVLFGNEAEAFIASLPDTSEIIAAVEADMHTTDGTTLGYPGPTAADDRSKEE